MGSKWVSTISTAGISGASCASCASAGPGAAVCAAGGGVLAWIASDAVVSKLESCIQETNLRRCSESKYKQVRKTN